MKKQKILYIALAVLIIYMFASIFVTVGLTGGREIEDFTDKDKTIFTVFVVLEIIAVVFMFTVALLIRKASGYKPIPKPKLTALDKAFKKRDAMFFWISFATSLVSALLGVIILRDVNKNISGVAFLSCLSILVLTLLINSLVGKVYVNRFTKKSNSEMVTFLYSHREQAEKSSKLLLGKLRQTLTITKVYTVIIGILGVALSFTAAGLGLWSFMTLIASCVIYASVCRVPLPYPKELFSADNGYVNEEEYPELYSVAKEAAQTLGVDGEIKIVLLADFTAGIRRFGNVISIQIGAMLFGSMSREELKNILLHEFGHLKGEESHSREITEHNWWLSESGGKPATLSYITDALFKLPDSFFGINYMIYSYASSIGIEEKADEAMRTHGTAKYAGSSFLKLQYYTLYEWEKGSYDTSPFCESEELKANFIENELKRFKEQIALRRDFWNHMIDVEIISRSASHPTVKMRLNVLGHTDYSLHESDDSEFYKNEQKKVIAFVDGKIQDHRKSNYEKERKESYLRPLEIITKWESSDQKITPDGYREIIDAYMTIGKPSKALELCDRVIEELPNGSNHFAHHIKGCILLHSFDESGIDYIYKAIENNHNYIEVGLETIGQFCCLSGRQDDLDIYREKALKIGDEMQSKYSEVGKLTPKDNITSESLVPELRNDVHKFISTLDEAIEEVYLVRKIITDDFFTSPVIIKLREGTSEEKEYEIFNRIFLYLDSVEMDWQFSLFDYRNVPMQIIKKIPSSLFYKNSSL